jgi:hypothetical protein
MASFDDMDKDIGGLRFNVDVGMNLQDIYDRAIAMAAAWQAMARSLATTGRVCTHPESKRINVTDAVVICSECQTVLEQMPDG